MPDLYGAAFHAIPHGCIGVYSLMSGGVGVLDPWSKTRLGFVAPKILTVESGMDFVTLDIHSIGADEPRNVIKVRSPVCTSQYFLIENRQQIGFDYPLAWYGSPETHSGILIWHIDENVMNGTARGFPNRNWRHRGVSPIGVGKHGWYYNPFFRADGRRLLTATSGVVP